MADLVRVLALLGILPYIVGIIVAYGAIALYFAFIKKA